MKQSIAIVGCGKVGISLGKVLKDAGYEIIGLASRSISSAKHAADMLGCTNASDHLWEITRTADIVFLTTPDGAIADTCTKISEKGGFRERAIVFHCSGALPSSILKSAKQCHAFIGSMHPLQSFASIETARNPFSGIIISAEGDDEAVKTARDMTADIGATFIKIQTDAKTLYHASAVAASNYLVTLMSLAFKMIGKAGVSSSDAMKALKPLLEGTISNIETVGIPAALTGPISRGDVETVQRHVEEMALKTPELLPLYKILGFYTIAIARDKGTLSESAANALKQIFES